MQETRIYDYMIRSGTVRYKWSSGSDEVPIIIGPDKPAKGSEVVVWCKLTTERGGLRAQILVDNDLGLPLQIQAISIETTVFIESGTGVFCNGYQSWSKSPVKRAGIDNLKSPVFCSKTLKKSGDYNFTKYSSNSLHSWSYTYFTSRLGYALIASLDESLAFTKFVFYKDRHSSGYHLKIEKDCDGLVLPVVPRTSKERVPPVKIADIFIATGTEENCWDRYFSLFYEISPEITKNRSLSALCWDSWYLSYDEIEEIRVADVLKDYSVRQIPLDYFIIGRGYEKQFGDFATPDADKFPGGLERICKMIKKAGYKPGITISPFVCSSKSQLYKERKELLARDGKGNLICIGKSRSLGGKLFLIDLYNPEGEKYIKRLIKNLVTDTGFEILKVDFLYAASLNAGRGFGRTRAQAMEYALRIIRRYAGHTPVIACGVQLASAFGLFEHVSVAPELSAKWEKHSRLAFCGTIREKESVYNAIQTAITRRHLNSRAFGSDACTFSLRKYRTKLSNVQQEALYETAIVFGSLISSSDSIGSYSSELLSKYRTAISHRSKISGDKKILKVENSEDGILVEYFLKGENKIAKITDMEIHT